MRLPTPSSFYQIYITPGSIVFSDAHKLVFKKHWGVVIVVATRSRPELYKINCVWGCEPYTAKRVNLGSGLGSSGRFDHPLKAHLAVIRALQLTPEFKAVYAAVDVCLRQGTPFVLRFQGQPLTNDQLLATCTAVHNALAQWWLLEPADQRALPFLVRALKDLSPERTRALMAPVGLQFQPAGADSLYVDGYFLKSPDKAVCAAFTHFAALSPEARTGFPFHALVLEERKKLGDADVALVLSSSRLGSSNWPRAWPVGFAVGPSEPLPQSARDPAYLNAGDTSFATVVVSLVVFFLLSLGVFSYMPAASAFAGCTASSSRYLDIRRKPPMVWSLGGGKPLLDQIAQSRALRLFDQSADQPNVQPYGFNKTAFPPELLHRQGVRWCTQ
jgi:hypothetical protein